ncbi:MAG: GH3 auxin-responsive promoter family protein [Mycobacterium leprae]
MSGRIGRLTANSLWLLSCLPDWWAFRRDLQDVAGTQERYLLSLVRRNAETEFGRRHGFDRIRTVADYQAAVPLSTYEDYREDVAAIAAGRPGVLTREPVQLLELTSGSTAATKQVPYTAGLKADFQRAIAPWIADLYLHDWRLLRGQSYWSVSPVARRNQRTAGGIPIGFEEDADYLGGLQRRVMQSLMAVPSAVRLLSDMETFRYVTLLWLLRSRSLGLISVWNPTFLTLLLERLPEWLPRLADDLAAGTLSVAVPDDLRADLTPPPTPRRADAVRAAGPDPARLWRNLRLVSCWTDANAAPYAPQIAALFPRARLQGKGLLATEGFVSFPLVGQEGAALALRSHFFELLPEGGGEPLLAHRLEQGGRYSVVLTTSGGLYRYQLHDLVEVAGQLGAACPLLRFLGKEAHVSDRFGEKVNEQHVREALQSLTAGLGLAPAFAMVACEGKAYTLFIEAPDASDEVLLRLGSALEGALRENFHYQYCRNLGQLEPVRVFRIDPGQGSQAYLQACVARGQRAGDVKPTSLHHLDGWLAIFPGRLLA